MMEKMISIIKNGEMHFPYCLFFHYKELSLTEKDIFYLIYLLNEKSNVFNPKKISEEMKVTLSDVLEEMDCLSTKGMIKISLEKINGLREEHIYLDGMYEKMAYLLMNGEELQSQSTTIYDIFEQEFGRTLSPMEYEIIGGWRDAGFEEELIVTALKEATYNGVSNLRYIDKILYEWKKKGFTKKEDVLKNRSSYQSKVTEKKELFDYDWLNDTDE